MQALFQRIQFRSKAFPMRFPGHRRDFAGTDIRPICPLETGTKQRFRGAENISGLFIRTLKQAAINVDTNRLKAVKIPRLPHK